MKKLISLVAFLCLSQIALGSEIERMVIGRYEDTKERDAISSKKLSRIQTIVVLGKESIFHSLRQDMKNAEVENVKWYMWDAIPVYFLDAQGKIVIGLEYWPVTKPQGGFREIQIHQNNGKIFAKIEAPKKTGYILPHLAKLIDSKSPKGFVWPSKEEK